MSDEAIKKSLFEIAEKAANRDDIYFDGHASTELSKLLHNALALINRQQERIEELEIITGLANNRKYYRRFVDEVFCKQKGNELSEPDFDYIYQLYFEQQAEIERLKGWQDLLKAEKHSLIKAEAIKGFAERLKGAKKYSVERHENIVPVAVIDWIVQEMVGEQDDTN